MSDLTSPCLICGDSAEWLPRLAPGSVHCVVTSPPYDDLRTYGTGGALTWDFRAIADGLYRVLADGGIVCWNVGDSVVDGSETLTSMRQAIWFRDTVGFRVHDTMIWHKPNFSNPERSRYHQLFEYVFILSKGKPRTFNPIRDKLNKYPNGPWGKNTYRLPNGEMAERDCNPASEFGMRGNVWAGNTVGQESPTDGIKHPARMPYWLARDLVLSWSDPDDVVLDPFMGSCTTGLAALATGRQFIGIEISTEYYNESVGRIKPIVAQSTLRL